MCSRELLSGIGCLWGGAIVSLIGSYGLPQFFLGLVDAKEVTERVGLAGSGGCGCLWLLAVAGGGAGGLGWWYAISLGHVAEAEAIEGVWLSRAVDGVSVFVCGCEL